ncbi:MAG TPA: WYL domain-containing protein, partial [Elusimicrobiales bacterium]|nr:WYL domain-containing protein [Elusimicrobiales bacterium]
AIERRRLVRLTYNSEEKAKTYTVEPLKLLFCEGYWYLVSRLSGMEWIFKNRLDRIEKIQVLEETFKAPKNLNKILRDSPGIWFTEKRDKKVLLKIDSEIAEAFMARGHLPLQKVRARRKDGSVVLETTLCHYMEAIPVIYRFIPFITVLSPNDLAESVRRNIAAYMKRLKK